MHLHCNVHWELQPGDLGWVLIEGNVAIIAEELPALLALGAIAPALAQFFQCGKRLKLESLKVQLLSLLWLLLNLLPLDLRFLHLIFFVTLMHFLTLTLLSLHFYILFYIRHQI